MHESLIKYFQAEKAESLLFMLVGLVAIAIAIWLWMHGHRLKAMAYPLVAIALIQLVVGGSVYFRTDAQVAQLTQQSKSEPKQFQQAETSRMQTVMKNFTLYKGIEMALVLIGMLMILFFQRYDTAAAIGAGLVLQSAFMLCLDMFAEARGQDYLKALGTL
jgi:energy-converting hydrogenase Eha subunit C